jgi:hypothetical protein
MKMAANLACFAVIAAVPAQSASDSQIKQKIIKESIDSYPGNCPCPYNRDRAGGTCGPRSAYSRPGGYAPKCYASDVSAEDVRAYRQRH